jgi:hypothetical protein
VSVNSFTLAGDQTSAFAPGRRLKFTITAGTAYGTIYTSAFASVTTVTMVMDSTGNLDSGLSAVSYGFLHATNPSTPSVAQVTLASATTTNLASASGPSLHVSGVTAITSFGNAPSGLERTVVFDGVLTLTHNGASLILPGAANITTAAGDVGVFVSEGSGNWRCVSYVGKNASFNNVVTSGTLTYGGVTLANAVTGTGNMVLSASPTFTGTAAHAAGSFSGNLTLTGLTIDTGGATNLSVKTNSGTEQLRINHTASADRYLTITGGVSGSGSNATIGSSGGGVSFSTRTAVTQSADAAVLTGTFTSSAATAGNQYGVSITLSGDPNNATNYFLQGIGNLTERATIRANGGLANFSANNVNLSDATVKTGLRPAGSYWNFIKRLQVVDGYYADDVQTHGAGAKRHTMLTAQNVQEVERALRVSWMDSVVTKFDENGHLGVQEHSVEMRHLRVTQELQARVESLEKKLATLEARIAGK